jgi:L-2-hydroxyglutarate oxidase LhgO
MDNTKIIIIGAGVVGLAVAFELSGRYGDLIVVEKNDSFGQETSSRNSEVIHAGIYYPKGSLKASLCVEGRKLLYEFCTRYNVPHKKIGKLIVATNEEEAKELYALFMRGRENGVDDLCRLSTEEIREREPNVNAVAALFSPSTGIIDSHALMKTLAFRIESSGGMIAYGNKADSIKRTEDGYIVKLVDKSGEETELFAPIVINAGGLWADKVAAIAGINDDEYKIKFCKGDYFRVNSRKARMVRHLIYPVPTRDHVGLGTHATLDLAGEMRLGPDTSYVDEIDYSVDPSKQKIFYESVKPFLPFIEIEDLMPDTAGMRPKLQGPGEKVRDFIIREESGRGLPGFINLIGIESPGLTACLAIGKKVAGLIKLS